jgi:transglutaminase-like putative cysteine protease
VKGRALLAAAGCTAIASFGLSSEAGLPWPVVLLAAAALFVTASLVQLPPLPSFLRAALRLLAVAAAAGAALVTVLARQVPIIPEAPGREWAGVVGFTLAALVAVGLLSRRDVGQPRLLLPTTVALLVTAGLGYSRPDFLTTSAATRVPLLFLAPSAAAALLLWAWAVVSGGPRPSRRGLATFFGTAAAIAVGLIVFLPVAQPHVERAVAQALTGGTTGLSEGSNLGDVASLAQSDRVVLRVWTARPQLLRAWALDRFDGRGWTAAPGRGRELRPVAPPSPPVLAHAAGSFFLLPPRELAEGAGPGAVETRVVPAVREGWPLLVPASPVLVRAPVRWLDRSALGVLRADQLPAIYGVASRPGPPDPPPTASALQLPPVVDPRVRDLAAGLAAGARSDREKLERTIAHLHGGSYRYTLDVGRFRPTDPLAEFLFEKRAGYCEYFATAAAVLLRLQGVPARFVKGFSVGPHTEAAGHHVVRDRDAHAWIEAWLAGEGWVEADPTPPRDFASLHPRRPLASVAEWVESLRAAGAQAWALVSAGEWRQAASRTLGAVGRRLERLVSSPAAGAALLLAAAAAAIVRWRRRSGRPRARPLPHPSPASPELRALLQRLDRHWTRAGVPRPPSRGPLEHLQRLPPAALPAPALDTSRRVVDAYYQAAFAGRPPDAARVEKLGRDLATLDEG